MKLILCTKCHDIFKLSRRERSCFCGACAGQYEADDHHAWFSGKHAIPLGLDNYSMRSALLSGDRMIPARPGESFAVERPTLNFRAWVFPEGYERFVRREEAE